jgi:hypothetical protein
VTQAWATLGVEGFVSALAEAGNGTAETGAEEWTELQRVPARGPGGGNCRLPAGLADCVYKLRRPSRAGNSGSQDRRDGVRKCVPRSSEGRGGRGNSSSQVSRLKRGNRQAIGRKVGRAENFPLTCKEGAFRIVLLSVRNCKNGLTRRLQILVKATNGGPEDKVPISRFISTVRSSTSFSQSMVEQYLTLSWSTHPVTPWDARRAEC